MISRVFRRSGGPVPCRWCARLRTYVHTHVCVHDLAQFVHLNQETDKAAAVTSSGY